MLYEFDTILGEGGWVFFGPDFMFGDFEDGGAVLEHEVEVGVEMR